MPHEAKTAPTSRELVRFDKAGAVLVVGATDNIAGSVNGVLSCGLTDYPALTCMKLSPMRAKLTPRFVLDAPATSAGRIRAGGDSCWSQTGERRAKRPWRLWRIHKVVTSPPFHYERQRATALMEGCRDL